MQEYQNELVKSLRFALDQFMAAQAKNSNLEEIESWRIKVESLCDQLDLIS